MRFLAFSASASCASTAASTTALAFTGSSQLQSDFQRRYLPHRDRYTHRWKRTPLPTAACITSAHLSAPFHRSYSELSVFMANRGGVCPWKRREICRSHHQVRTQQYGRENVLNSNGWCRCARPRTTQEDARRGRSIRAGVCAGQGCG